MEPNKEIHYSSSVNLDRHCQKCGTAKRKGSITAWVFGKPAAVCNCLGSEALDATLPFTVESDLPLEGEIIDGRYQLIEVIGKGGMGKVYRAKHLHLHQDLALKMLRQELITHSSTLKRFAQEAKATSALSHPNLVSVYDFGITEAGVPYFVMELVSGASLADMVAEKGPIPIDVALNLFEQICRAIEHAHSRNTVHRDIKPSNILVTKKEDGSDLVKVVDFGIAKIISDDGSDSANITQTGNLLGSPFYMSPEHCSGEKTDSRADIYSIGCVLFECITGSPPFNGTSPMKILLQHIKTDTSELRDKFIKHCVPLPVESIILRCLEKHPDDRYQTVEALRIDIEKARQGTRLTPVPNRKLITFQRRLKSINPGKALAVCLSIGAVYFLATVSIAVLTSNREHPPDWKTLDSQGQDQFNRGELSLAKATFERALSSARASNNDHRLVLASLEELLDLSRAEENLSDSAALVKEIAKLNVEQDKKADGLERELKTELSKPSIKDPQRLTSLFNNANDLAASLIEMAHYKKARSILELGKELCAKTLGPNCKPMTRFEHNLAYELHSEGRYTEAYDQYLKTLALERQVFKDGSNSLQSITLLDYGRLCMQIGKDAAVESTFQKCLELDKVLFGPQSPQVAWVRFNLAALYYRQGRNDDTRRELNTALAIYNSLDESQPGKEARCYLLLGLVNKDTDSLRKALALYQSATKKDYAFLLETLEGIGQQAENTEPKVAIPFVARALALSERLGEKDKDMEKSKLLSVLGRLYRKVSDLPNAEKAWARALYNRKKQFGDTSWPVFETLSDLAILNNDCGRSERAEEYFQNCFKILSLRRDNAYSPKVIRKTLFWYAQMHKTEEPSRISEAIPQRWRHLMPQHVKLGNALSPPVKPKSSARI